jgi:phytoene dehydrogenase-like protein
MRGFWRDFVQRYQSLGGELRVGCLVNRIAGGEGAFTIHTRRGAVAARQVVCAVPIELTARLAPPAVGRRLQPFLERDGASRGGAVVVFLGVPEAEVDGHEFTHHQLLHDYEAPLGNGNNMFVSISASGDRQSAPPGARAVMISTHCELAEWRELSDQRYTARKLEIGGRLVALARRVYPRLASGPYVLEVGAPPTYERFTRRPEGAVGGVRQTLANSNQRAVPHDAGLPGLWLVGDTTWPGLGTVACVVGSRIVAEEVRRRFRKRRVRKADHRQRRLNHDQARRHARV